MYAVIQTGGKQLRVEVGQVVHVERLAGEAGAPVVFDRVLMLNIDDAVRVGAPILDGARVSGTIVGERLHKKLLSYIYKRRQNSNRKSRAHRQRYTAVKIDSIDA